MQSIAALLVHRVEDLVGSVESDEVEECEGTHRQTAAEPHRVVDVLAARVLLLEHRDRMVEVTE